MQTVIEHIASYGIAESVEEVGAHGDGCHIEPSLVVNEVGKLLERELLCAFRLQTFLGKESVRTMVTRAVRWVKRSVGLRCYDWFHIQTGHWQSIRQ